MAFYHTCPDCGASLDPGERCECANPEVQAAGAPDYAGFVDFHTDPVEVFALSY